MRHKLARNTAGLDVPGEKFGQHYVEQAIRAEVIAVDPLQGVRIAAGSNQAQLVGTGASEMLPHDFPASVVEAAVRVGKTGYLNAQNIFNDCLRLTDLRFDLFRGQMDEVRVGKGMGTEGNPILLHFPDLTPA